MIEIQDRLINAAAAWVQAAPRREDRQSRRNEVLRDFDEWVCEHLANPQPGEAREWWDAVIYLSGVPRLLAGRIDRARRDIAPPGRRTDGEADPSRAAYLAHAISYYGWKLV